MISIYIIHRNVYLGFFNFSCRGYLRIRFWMFWVCLKMGSIPQEMSTVFLWETPIWSLRFFWVRLKLDVFKIAKIYQKVYSMLRKKHSKIIGSVLGKTYRF